jgi:hypothetical protein
VRTADATNITLIVSDVRESWEKPGKKLYTYDVYLGDASIGQVKSEIRMHSQMSSNGRIRLRDFYCVEWNKRTPNGRWMTGWGYETRKDAIEALRREAGL